MITTYTAKQCHMISILTFSNITPLVYCSYKRTIKTSNFTHAKGVPLRLIQQNFVDYIKYIHIIEMISLWRNKLSIKWSSIKLSHDPWKGLALRWILKFIVLNSQITNCWINWQQSILSYKKSPSIYLITLKRL